MEHAIGQREQRGKAYCPRPAPPAAPPPLHLPAARRPAPRWNSAAAAASCHHTPALPPHSLAGPAGHTAPHPQAAAGPKQRTGRCARAAQPCAPQSRRLRQSRGQGVVSISYIEGSCRKRAGACVALLHRTWEISTLHLQPSNAPSHLPAHSAAQGCWCPSRLCRCGCHLLASGRRPGWR